MSWTCFNCKKENTDFDKKCIGCGIGLNPRYFKVKPKGEDIITIRLSPEERAQLEDIKQILDLSSDSTAFKLTAFRGWDVLQRTLGRDNLKWLADKERQSRGPK